MQRNIIGDESAAALVGIFLLRGSFAESAPRVIVIFVVVVATFVLTALAADAVVIVIVVVVCCCCNIYFLEVSAFLPLLEYVAKYCCLAKTGVFLKHADSYFPTQDGPMDKRMDKTL